VLLCGTLPLAGHCHFSSEAANELDGPRYIIACLFFGTQFDMLSAILLLGKTHKDTTEPFTPVHSFIF
jgi:hypothetical protein